MSHPELPPPPKGYRASIRHEWTRIAKSMADQGIAPLKRVHFLQVYIDLHAEEDDLQFEWREADLKMKLALGRRFSAIASQKIRVLRQLFAPERTKGGNPLRKLRTAPHHERSTQR